MARSAKPLFRAIRASAPRAADFPALDAPEVQPVDPPRDPLDYDPTPPEPTLALLAAEAKPIGRWLTSFETNVIWEPAVGGGHMARVIERRGWRVYGSDVVDRDYPGTVLKSFYDFRRTVSPVVITNPPYNQINARDGKGRWLQHAMDLGVPYMALLLNLDWMAARGLSSLLKAHPVSRLYVCRWKIDFRGGGSPPQRNGWFVWDQEHRGETVLRYLDRPRASADQGSLL